MNIQPGKLLSYRHLRWIVASFSVAVVVWSGYWMIVAGQIYDRSTMWVVQQQEAGFYINWNSFDVSGYPFSLDVDIRGIVVTAPTQWRWSADDLKVHGRFWDWSEFDVSSTGTHRFDLTWRDRQRTFALNAKSLKARIAVDGLAFKAISIQLTNVDVSDRQQRLGGLDSGQITLKKRAPRNDALELRLQGMEITGLSQSPFGSDIARLSARAELVGQVPASLTGDELARWRNLGGVIELRYINLGYAGIDLRMEGTLALDGELQPIASLTTRLQGYDSIITVMQDRGILGGPEALAARVVVGALSTADPATGEPSLDLAVTLQQRTVRAGPFVLGKIPPVIWP